MEKDLSLRKNFCGDLSCFKRSTIDNLLESGKASSQAQLERAIHVLEYLAQLKEAGLNPVHKGGSAVQLLLPTDLQRLSVDLDIAVSDRNDLEEAIEKIPDGFSGEFYNARLSREPEEGSVFLDYRVEIPTYGAGIVDMKLDVILREPDYDIQETRLETYFYSSEVKVRTPTINSILGDKLSTLGPNTIGRPLEHSGMGLDYVKHLFDIYNLLPHFDDFKAVRMAYKDCFEMQKDLKSLDKSLDIYGALEDMRYICKVLALDETSLKTAEAELPKSQFNEVKRHYERCLGGTRGGIRRMSPFLGVGISFTPLNVRELSAKLSFTASLLHLVCRKKLKDDLAARSLQGIDAVIDDILSDGKLETIITELKSIPESERWHIDIETQAIVSPRSLVYWFASHWTSEFIESYVR